MSSTTLWFGELSIPQSVRRFHFSPMHWTCAGALAIPLWATWPALAMQTAAVPPLETLAIMFLFGSVAFWLLHRCVSIDEVPPESTRSWIPGIVYAAALAGGNVCFLMATHRIPSAQTNVITYLWPVMIVGLGAVIGLFRLRLRHIFGLALGFAGAAVLIWDGRVSVSFSGIGLALLSGALWAGYCLFRLVWKQPCGNLLARGCALSAVLCTLLHFVWEPTVIPTKSSFAAAAIAGIVPLATGNFLWDQGFRRGDGQLLAVMAYATPLFSTLLLTVMGTAVLTWNLLVGAVVIVLAGMLSRAESVHTRETPACDQHGGH